MSTPTRTLAINLVQLLPNASGGIETYAHMLIPSIKQALSDWTVRVYVNREGWESYRSWSDECEWELVDFSWYDRFRRLHIESVGLPRRLRRDGADLVHSMVNTAVRRPGCPQVTTIFDATQILHDDTGLAVGPRLFRQLLKAAPRRSDAIVTISGSAAADIAKAFSIGESEIDVIHLAARAQAEADDETVRALHTRIGLSGTDRYFIAPLARRANKNIDRLLEAFARLGGDDVRLVLAGASGEGDDELRARAARIGFADRLVLTDWVTDGELDALYRGALALIFPSTVEGFGLPILEAMQCGCPVATADRSSMPEVGGDAALYFDPYSVEQITDAMRTLMSDHARRTELITKGEQRARLFSWRATADRTIDVYNRLLGEAVGK